MIFSAIAIAWLAYLVPHFARRRDDDPVDESDPAARFSDSMRILKRGTAPLLDQDLAIIKSFEVSTPTTRRAAIADLQRLERLAARRRRRVLIALLLVVSVVVGAYVAGYVPRWAPLVPAGLLLVFLLVARLSVRAMRRSLDARYDVICAGSDESTVLFSRRDVVAGVLVGAARTEEVSAKAGALWDPVPITMPTYVSKPLAPRTVRTIDLSGPEVSASPAASIPVTADPPPSQVEAESPNEGQAMPKSATA